jgi:hypothetical protein
MHAPTAIQALGVWERGQGQGPARRGLELLSLARPETSIEELADLSVGARNANLLELYAAMFGGALEGCTDCPACGEAMETSLAPEDLLPRSAARPDCRLDLTAGGYDVQLRLLTSRDLIAASQIDSAERRHELLTRCVVTAKVGDTQIPAGQLPAEIVDAAAQRLGAADPQADIRLSLACASCRHRWTVPFDILLFLWSKLDTWARRQLREIHVLASAYGWCEADILALSPVRRRHYLELVESWPTI